MKIYNTSEYLEKLKIRPVSVNDIYYEKPIIHKYAPDSREELISIIEQRVIDEGYECDLNDIDVSGITDMHSLFNCWDNCYKSHKIYIRNANVKIDKWDVSNVTNMDCMFYEMDKFNGDLSNWDVSKVTSMMQMFYKAEKFNGDISKWDVSNVTCMESMFEFAEKFEGDLSDWNVSNVTNMEKMFHCAKSLNCDLSKWKVDNVGNMLRMFDHALKFNSDISKWNVGKVCIIDRMFSNAESFLQDLSNWNVGSVNSYNHYYVFNRCPMEKHPEMQPMFA